MGRNSKDESGVEANLTLWTESELPRTEPAAGKISRGLPIPLWTKNKALLIQTYLHLFEMITHHGIYIDGFAAPQAESHPDMWSAKLVLEMTPKWFHDFWLCDINPKGIKLLKELRSRHKSRNRRINVLEGDFNVKVYEVLSSRRITENKATFALLDQRTFECEWRTVKALSTRKKGNKIELFYFFPTGWIDRALAAVRAEKTVKKVERWWGKADWRTLQKMDGIRRAMMVTNRFLDELGYASATPYPIHNEMRGGRVMYHMIHATDHPEAPRLMMRAYRKVSGRAELEPEHQQLDFEVLIQEILAQEK